jgi:sigma-B regulation protein RsbU (phosphoserine phosphatase)
LLRAIVKEVDSPARALERANNAIVPDAQSGMFVTIFYAVLDLNSGRLDYANAGHNPPLLVRPRSGEIERLVRGGMAIGVEAEAPIVEGHTVLDEEDFLVLYTDGVTEAFSPVADPFGEDRLLQTVKMIMVDESLTEPPSAQVILDGIEGAVRDFIAQTPLSDDLTLLVLQRKAKSA